MRKAAFAVLFACATLFAASHATAHADALNLDQLVTANKQTEAAIVLQQINKVSEAQANAAKAPGTEAPVEYEVKAGDSLAIIAEQHQTTWKRLFDKNDQISSPDIIAVGLKIVIPKTDELLAERALPQPVIAAQNTAQAAASAARPSATVQYHGSSSGNTYSPGYCTWYAKNMRPDLPNNLGNADTWVARAAAQGLATGSSPAVGAIGQQGMHVVYVQSVNGDGTVTISEMNYAGLYQITSRTVPASNFMYIY